MENATPGVFTSPRIAYSPSAPRLMAAMTAGFATGQIAGPVVVGVTDGFVPALLAASVVLALGALALTLSKESGGAREVA